MWSGDGRTLFYVSDRDGSENVWSRPAGKAVAPLAEGATAGAGPDRDGRRLTAFKDGRVLWPSITPDGKTIAFERDFAIWTLDTGSGQARPYPSFAAAPPRRRVRRSAPSPISRSRPMGEGRLRSRPRPGRRRRQGIRSPACLDARQPQIATCRPRCWPANLFYDFAAKETAPRRGATDLSPVVSPDGKQLAFLRNAASCTSSMAAGTDRTSPPAPSPTRSTIRRRSGPRTEMDRAFRDRAEGIHQRRAVPAAGGGRPGRWFPRQCLRESRGPEPHGRPAPSTPASAPSRQLARVDLTLRTPKFREDPFRDLFTEPASPRAETGREERRTEERNQPLNPGTWERNPRPVFPPFASASLRAGRPGRWRRGYQSDGKTAAMLASAAGQTNLYSYSLDELATERPVARQLSTTTGPKADPQFTPDSREIYFLDGGRIQIATVDRREVRPLAVTAEFTVDFATEKTQVFQQAWTLLRDNFFDAGFNGVNWESSRERYGQRAAAAGTADELRRIVSLMIGDLNSSHRTGAGGARDRPTRRAVDRRAYETGGRLTVCVIPLGRPRSRRTSPPATPSWRSMGSRRAPDRISTSCSRTPSTGGSCSRSRVRRARRARS